MALDPADITRRIAYVRYLHGLGDEQAKLPDPLASASLLMFHDAVESLLMLVAEYLEVSQPRDFEKYWDVLSPAKVSNGVDLPMRQGMARLNKQRVALKHYGSQPNFATVQTIRNDANVFLVAVTQLVFSVDYSAVSLASVIPQSAVRALVLNADAANAKGDRIEAMIALVDAWHELFDARHEVEAGYRATLRFGPAILYPLDARQIAEYVRSDNSQRRPRGNEDIGRQLAAVTDISLALQDAARVTVFGIDYKDYLRFRSLVPERSGYINGGQSYEAPSTYAPTLEHVAFCAQFLVTAALRVATVEAELADPAWIVDVRERRAQWTTLKDTRE